MATVEASRGGLRRIGDLWVACFAAALYAVMMGAMVSAHGWRKRGVLLACVPWATLVLIRDRERSRAGLAPFGLLALILVVPLAHLGTFGVTAHVVFQVLFVLVLALYWLLLPESERIAVLRRARPVVPYVAALAAAFALSYALSAIRGGRPAVEPLNLDPYLAVNFVLGSAFALLPAIVCRDIAGFTWLVRALFALVALEGFIVFLQVTQLVDKLPGTLAQLSATSLVQVDDSFASARSLRYVGSFGDYELLAEFCSVIFVIAFGFAVFRILPGERFSAPVAAVAAGGVGVLTGSRSMIVSIVLGTLVLLFVGVVLQPGSKVRWVMRGTMLVVMSACVVYLVAPSGSLTAYVARFSLPSASLTGPRAFNRAGLYKAGFKSAQTMPFFGYGNRMMDVFHRNLVGFKQIRSPHSVYLAIGLTAGIPGLLALLALFGRLLYLTGRMASSRGRPRRRQVGAVLLAAVVVWMANEAKIEFIRYPFYIDLGFVFFGLVGVASTLAFDEPQGGRGEVAAESLSAGDPR